MVGGGKTLSVGFLLANNFTLTALSSFIDALRLAADDGDGSRRIRCDWKVMGTLDKPVASSCGLSITPDAPLTDPDQFDYIVVVGGLLHRGPQLDARSIAFLHKAARANIPLIGVCTGSFILCREGLMDNRRCCVSWFHYQDFVGEFPDLIPIADQLYVVDKDRITCSGGLGVVDLAADLISRHIGQSAAQKSMHILQIDTARPADQAQPQVASEHQVLNQRARKAMLMMEQHLADPLPMEDIAKRLSVSSRQLERLFQTATGMSPARFYRVLRLRYGMWLLKNTHRTITEIAQESGFSDGAHFSRLFSDLYGKTPSDFRLEQRGTAPSFPAPASAWASPLADRRVYE